MEDQNKFKVIGALVVGFAIVAGAFTLKNFGKTDFAKPVATDTAAVAIAAAPNRVAIPVRDSNSDGVEDWQEEFFDNTKKTIILDAAGANDPNYEVPKTLTGQTGISVLREMVNMKGLEGFGPTEEEIIAGVADSVREFAADDIIDSTQIKIDMESSPQAIRTYANALANIVIEHGLNETVPEVDSLRALVLSGKTDSIKDLQAVAAVYDTLLKKTMALEAPIAVAKEHLDLVNVFQAIKADVDSMTIAEEDPLATFARLKRYQNDAQGMVYAIQNIYKAIEPYAAEFERTDPAILLVTLDASLRN